MVKTKNKLKHRLCFFKKLFSSNSLEMNKLTIHGEIQNFRPDVTFSCSVQKKTLHSCSLNWEWNRMTQVFCRNQCVRSQGVETSGVERSSCDARVWVLPKRQNKMADIILDRQGDYPASVSHYPVIFICCKQQRRNRLFFVTFVFCFVQFFPREQISVLNIVPPP